jgi:hypothetical protein
MVTTNTRALIEKSIPGRLAREVTSQATAGLGDSRRLKELGFTPLVADLIAQAIGGSAVARGRLAELGVPSTVIADLI